MPRHVPRYGVFIIESMDWDNERNNNLDGAALKAILDLAGIDNEYIYIRTHQEFEHALSLFGESDFGFLHLSCHGNAEELCLTMDNIPFQEVGEMMGPLLKYRRLFLSACEAACFDLAKHLIPQYHCYSIIGPAGQIDYDKAAIFWSSYYYLMYQSNQERMWQPLIIPTLKNITRTFSEAINYFSIITERNPIAKHSLNHFQIVNGEIIRQGPRQTAFHNLYWEEAQATIEERYPGTENRESSSS